jgi:NADH-quinone oxidoreductase subunit J
MEAVFYISGAAAVAATAAAVTRRNAAHALLYLVVSLLAVAVVFYTLGAPYIAALEVIVYAGAIMVLFVFVIMMLNPSAGNPSADPERGDASLRDGKLWIGPALLSIILGIELMYLFGANASGEAGRSMTAPGAVGVALLGPYVLGVELASMLLLAALVGAYHLGRRDLPGEVLPAEGGGGRE